MLNNRAYEADNMAYTRAGDMRLSIISSSKQLRVERPQNVPRHTIFIDACNYGPNHRPDQRCE